MAHDYKDTLHLSGEFAQLCGIAKSTLHYYVSLGLIEPAYISESNYSYYATKQVYTIHLIGILQKAGCSLNEISEYLHEQTDSQKYHQIFLEKEKELLQKKNDLERTLMTLHSINHFATYSMSSNHNQIFLQTIEKSQSLLTTAFQEMTSVDSPEYADGFRRHLQLCDKTPEAIKYPMGRILTQRNLLMGDYRYSHLFSYMTNAVSPENTYTKLHKGLYVGYVYKPIFTNISDVCHTLLQYIESHNYTILGDAFELKLSIPYAHNSDDTIFISIPIV